MAEKKEGVEAAVRTIRRVTRKKHSTEEKVRIVLEGLRGEISIAALCRREGIPSNLYYRWSKEFLEAGKWRLVGDTERQADSRQVAEMGAELEQLKQLVAELSLKNRVLKKACWARNRCGTNDAPVPGGEEGDHPPSRAFCLYSRAHAGGTGCTPQQFLSVVSAVPAGGGRGVGAAGVEAPAILEPAARGPVRPDRSDGAGSAGEVGPATGLALHRPGRLFHLGIKRIPASEALRPG